MDAVQLKSMLPYLELPLINILLEEGTIVKLSQGKEIIKQDSFISSVPIVLNGLIKVATRSQDKSLLLYDINQGESCVMSFSACLKESSSKVFAITKEPTTVLLLPISKIRKWLKEYPSLNTLFYAQFDTRYTDLLENIQQLLFYKIDDRLYSYLKEKVMLHNEYQIKMTHQEIANDLATAREVISRALKKLEIENKVQQTPQGIIVL